MTANYSRNIVAASHAARWQEPSCQPHLDCQTNNQSICARISKSIERGNSMRRPYLPRLIKPAVLLFVLLIPFFGPYKEVVTANLSEAQSPASCSDSAANCRAPVKYLGDNKGCSCFVCEYGRKTQKILCSMNVAEKNKFRAMLSKPKKAR